MFVRQPICGMESGMKQTAILGGLVLAACGSAARSPSTGQTLVEDGFMAATLADEKPAGPAQRVSVAQAFKDVSHEIRDGIDQIKDPAARREEAEKRIKTLIAACEKDRPNIRCTVRPYFG